jgi:hypothetical protein
MIQAFGVPSRAPSRRDEQRDDGDVADVLAQRYGGKVAAAYGRQDGSAFCPGGLTRRGVPPLAGTT